LDKLAFLADMNISPLTVEHLRQKGWNIIRVSDCMDKTSTDEAILRYAQTTHKVIITQDLDFSDMLALGGYSNPSVISLRVENASPDVVTERVIAAVSALERELAQGIIVSVDESSVRYRDLPIA
jgi:predicted nuclease of predicted toxin-antitoxin system